MWIGTAQDPFGQATLKYEILGEFRRIGEDSWDKYVCKRGFSGLIIRDKKDFQNVKEEEDE